MSNPLRRSLLLIASSTLLLWLAGRHRFATAPSARTAGTHSTGSALLAVVAIGVLVLGTWLAVLALRRSFRDEEPLGDAVLVTIVAECVALAVVRGYFAAAKAGPAVALAAQETRRAPSKSAGIVGILLTLAVLIGASVAITRVRRLVQ
jgi:hypothetical protein